MPQHSRMKVCLAIIVLGVCSIRVISAVFVYQELEQNWQSRFHSLHKEGALPASVPPFDNGTCTD